MCEEILFTGADGRHEQPSALISRLRYDSIINMNKLKQLWRVLTHPRELRLALSGLGMRLSGEDSLGGLSQLETDALVKWVNETGAKTVIEIGTLFGLTAKALDSRTPAKVIAVDNFCWNPFGLTVAQHTDFTSRILEGSEVEIICDNSLKYLSDLKSVDALVFLDGDHSYDGVKRELEILKSKGVRLISGHDFGNPLFGVTRAVREVLGEPDEVVGMCWFKRI